MGNTNSLQNKNHYNQSIQFHWKKIEKITKITK